MIKFVLPVGALLMTLSIYSQESMQARPTSAADLSQYLWSFSKNNAKTSENALIDFDAINNWRTLGNYLAVSDDGKYFAYTINKHTGTRYWFPRQDSLVVQSTTGSWRMAFGKSEEGFFTRDGRQYIFQKGDELQFVQLGTARVYTTKNIVSVKANQNKTCLAWKTKDNDSLLLRNLATGKQFVLTQISDYNFEGRDKWLACHTVTSEFILHNVLTGKEKRFQDILAWSFSANGKALLLNTTPSFQYVNLETGTAKILWTSTEKASIASYKIDDTGQQVVFQVVDSANASKSSMWYFRAGMEQAAVKLSDAVDIPEGCTLSNAGLFSDNGKYIQFELHQKRAEARKANDDVAGVQVWSAKEATLQSLQITHLDDVPVFHTIFNIQTGNIVFRESIRKRVLALKGDVALVGTEYPEVEKDRFWERPLYKDSTWIVSLNDGSSQLLPTKLYQNFWFSPDGNWLVYFDASQGCQYYSYNLLSGETTRISDVANNGLGITHEGSADKSTTPQAGKLAAWIADELAVLVYSNYDIWKLDLTGTQPAINLTNGYGQGSRTVLNLLESDHYSPDVPVVTNKEPLILKAFNRESKLRGFYKITNLIRPTIEQLYLGKYFTNPISGCDDPNMSHGGMKPIKSKNARFWIVQRQSTSDAPNYYSTTDLKNYRRLTNMQPQTQYKWLTQELHSFKYLDGGARAQGILYKPADFDASKKYPVVIAFYDQFANNMYQFCMPDYMDQSMQAGKSPIWFLNNGFLVFAPDVTRKPLKHGPNAFSCIEGAAKYLKQLPYIDGNKLAFASHSASAHLASYIFTHSTTFTAASLTEGYCIANMISPIGYLNEDGPVGLFGGESDSEGGNFWENKMDWLDQTTVIHADKANAALLLLSDKGSRYQRDQSTQLYMALRRLDKNGWWLEYDNGGHRLVDLKERQDYTIRYTQFLDHYLNNSPAPHWMTEGVPFKLKQVENRYGLDPQGKCSSANGESCAICEAWNEQHIKTPSMFKNEIKDWHLDVDIEKALKRKQDEKRRELDKKGQSLTKEVLEKLNMTADKESNAARE